MAYQDPYDQYMSQYDGYDPKKPSAGSSYLTSGATGAASGAAVGTEILPGWGTAIGAGVGLLGSLYGNYVAQGTAEKNYQNQVGEFERSRAVEAEQIARSKDAARLAAMYAAKASADSDQDRLLSRYASYFRGIGR